MKKLTDKELELYATSHLDAKVQGIAHELISSREIIKIIDEDNDEGFFTAPASRKYHGATITTEREFR